MTGGSGFDMIKLQIHNGLDELLEEYRRLPVTNEAKRAFAETIRQLQRTIAALEEPE